MMRGVSAHSGMTVLTLVALLTSGCAGPREGALVLGRANARAILPGVRLDENTRELALDGHLCLEQGILEYLAVAQGGKEYECLLSLHCRPSQLQVAMLLAGYQTGEVDPEVRGDFAPQAEAAAPPQPQGAPQVQAAPNGHYQAAGTEPTVVTLDVEVRQADGTWKRQPIEDFLIDRSTGRRPPRLVWAFTGSFFYQDEKLHVESFMADVEKSIVALWYDPTCLLNLTQDVGNPYRSGDAGLETHAAALPPKGTPVRLILRPMARTSKPTKCLVRPPNSEARSIEVVRASWEFVTDGQFHVPVDPPFSTSGRTWEAHFVCYTLSNWTVP